MGKTSDYQKKAYQNYIEKFDVVSVRLPKGDKDNVKLYADRNNMTVNEVCVKAIRKYIGLDVI